MVHRTLPEYRDLARRLVEHACGGAGGRPESDPFYQLVTEGRDRGAAQKSYSSCGDLAHWLLYRLGVRAPWINRAEHQGWRSGRNVSTLAWEAPNAVRRTPAPSSRYAAGDVLIVWNRADGTDAHVLVALEHDGNVLLSGDYGQPGGKLCTRVVTARPVQVDGGRSYDAPFLGARQIQRWLPLGVLLEHLGGRGELAPPDDACLRDTDPAPPPSSPIATPMPTLRRGDRGEAVRELQRRLNARFAADEQLVVDGEFGARTEQWVRAYQRARQLVADGVAGPRTWHVLTVEDRT
jgi:hypothetical protein